MLEEMGAFFDARVKDYDWHQLHYIENAGEFYLYTAHLLPWQDRARVLDLGCGTGLELQEYFLLNPSARVTGIDLAPEMLAVLRQKFRDRILPLICGSYFDVPFGENCFDAVVSVESLHHFTAGEKLPLFRKIQSALRDGGYFILTDYYALSETEELARRSELDSIKKAGNTPENVFFHYDTPLTVEHERDALLQAGFSSVAILHSWGATCTLRADK